MCGRNAFPGEAQVAVGPTRGRGGFCVLPAPTHHSFCQPNASRRRVLSVTRPGNQCRVAVSFHSSQRFKELCFAGVPRGRRCLHPRHLGLRGACDPVPRSRSLPPAQESCSQASGLIRCLGPFQRARATSHPVLSTSVSVNPQRTVCRLPARCPSRRVGWKGGRPGPFLARRLRPRNRDRLTLSGPCWGQVFPIACPPGLRVWLPAGREQQRTPARALLGYSPAPRARHVLCVNSLAEISSSSFYYYFHRYHYVASTRGFMLS